VNRAQYNAQRRSAHHFEVEASFLIATTDHAQSLSIARRLRAEIAAPADPVEAARNARWARLGAALELAAKAKVLRDMARRTARRVAA
jgi:hypothetical protein